MDDNINKKQPIRVLQIIGVVCGGGVEAVIMNYYRNIDRNKIQFDFIIDGYEKSLLDDEIESLGGKVYKVEPYSKNIFKYIYQIYRIIKENNYQIIHSNMNTLSVFSLFAAWLAGAKIRIIHNHSTAVKSEKMRSLLKYILRPFNTIFANKYLACSRVAGKWMFGQKAVKTGKIKIINNAINIDKFIYNENLRQQLRKELDIKEDTLVIGHVGRFMYQKNHDFLIEVFNKIYEQDNNSILLLIGDGPLKQTIKNKIEKYGLGNSVKFLGVRKDVNKLYNVMDIFLFPSHYEGLGMVGVEAQINGLHCLVADNIPSEIKISDKIKFLPISDSNLWASEILKIELQADNRKIDLSVAKTRFDIAEESKSYENFIKCGATSNDS
ncbi:glycosyltransferase family 1 protein [Pectinatus sottacetonis]|uniref:glycosyltransferase family 1 protein n=1 Tax=Pectinatus sottacetonis TaxID=1002795 RepID=UPI0018C61CAA|nr:glycosyltransferase family 1 protein [Pectinatus sottacetonis]